MNEADDCCGMHANRRVTIGKRGLCNLLAWITEFSKSSGKTALDFEIAPSQFKLQLVGERIVL
ncbi:hypothetical protein [Leucobacter sp. GX24907]